MPNEPRPAHAPDAAGQDPDRNGAERTAAQRTADHRSVERLGAELLPALIGRLTAGGLAELEVREGDWKVRLRRPRDGVRPAATRPDDPPGTPPATAPAVGIFRPLPGILGRQVHAGDRVGSVDVLGVPQEVIAGFQPASGRRRTQRNYGPAGAVRAPPTLDYTRSRRALGTRGGPNRPSAARVARSIRSGPADSSSRPDTTSVSSGRNTNPLSPGAKAASRTSQKPPNTKSAHPATIATTAAHSRPGSAGRGGSRPAPGARAGSITRRASG